MSCIELKYYIFVVDCVKFFYFPSLYILYIGESRSNVHFDMLVYWYRFVKDWWTFGHIFTDSAILIFPCVDFDAWRNHKQCFTAVKHLMFIGCDPASLKEFWSWLRYAPRNQVLLVHLYLVVSWFLKLPLQGVGRFWADLIWPFKTLCLTQALVQLNMTIVRNLKGKLIYIRLLAAFYK